MPARSEKEDIEFLQEKVPLVVKEEEPKLDKEVEKYFEKVEEEQYLSQPVTDDAGQVLVSPAAPQKPQIVLPVTQVTYNLGLTKKVSDSLRWLSEWCRRLLKIFGSRAIFREEKVRR
ncbi:MAG TPA: hypothetical protein VMW25_03930 [Clostridia bacterium]|nr:hypothetical protein [Clostridia bacterium]